MNIRNLRLAVSWRPQGELAKRKTLFGTVIASFGFSADFYGDFRLFFFEKEFFEVGFYPVAAAASFSFGFLIDAVENSRANVNADRSCPHAYHISFARSISSQSYISIVANESVT